MTGAVTRAVMALVEDTFAALHRIGTAMAAVWEQQPAPRSTDLIRLRSAVFTELAQRPELFNGAGVVVAEDALADEPRYLQWWRNGGTGAAPTPLRLDLDPGSEYFYDYSDMEWFTTPRDRGIRTVHGPYLDFTGVDINVCTFAVPATSAGGSFIGIAGADVPVAAIDSALMPVLRDSRPLALINAAGRVIVSNDSDHLPGARLAQTSPGIRHPVPESPWTLVFLAN
ncbi:hypothetical protein MMUR_09960 [Mycolicibacterium murale]|uniref:Cache domain-containing protein n=1 Tax=Mycolicibacterium murale TaxID=182220 RepID=A0A7I9WHT6_9MYCO|nr:cache domain-containing protein [Mycolicibacterium murale]MCV7180638.1 hypothetical protein [Mycolicibacterium murale]GFG56860.1 hypothetical protein MMUR_09960 [Mycolicibacterium murale]